MTNNLEVVLIMIEAELPGNINMPPVSVCQEPVYMY